MAVIGVDAKNMDARRELATVRQKMVEAEQKQKATFAGFFSKAGGDLYSEREAELRGPDKGVVAGGAKPEKLTEAAKPSGDTPKPKKSDPSPKIVAKTDDGVDLDEEDLKILEETKKKGYCYFRRELTEEERALRETQHVPQKLDASAESVSAVPPQQIQGVSEWNAKGTTYEEKDTTQWCIKMLGPMIRQLEWESEACHTSMDESLSNPSKFMKILDQVKAGLGNTVTPKGSELSALMEQIHPIKISVTEAPEVKGEAQVMVVRGSKRHFFEFKISAPWKIVLMPALDGQEERSFEGKLEVEEFSSTVREDDFLKSIKVTVKREQRDKASEIDRQLLDVCFEKLKSEVVRVRQEFEKIYQDRQ
eukprot:Protomagalhaensia_sp_Gyna_25__5514@NODE_73_length_5593_cov_125_550234_g55_i0_p3_GENE_NODE_73_length_5593_cov_125_550234_g55_i0NODE_73_length_5593_cov_125_550234_g55_i0_p3_ORF_typecomplete_len364_score85_29Aha1_N/PF09229_11/2_4e16_NODE_73_length_5593_cov_125_550234_g55_i023063397